MTVSALLSSLGTWSSFALTSGCTGEVGRALNVGDSSGGNAGPSTGNGNSHGTGGRNPTGNSSGGSSGTSTGGKGTGNAGSGGSSNSNPGSGGMTTQPPMNGVPGAQACTGNSPGPRKIRRLTSTQFAATLRDIFKDNNVPVVTIFSDPQVLGFTSDADALVVQDLNAQQMADYAEQVASWAVTSKLGSLSSCMTNDSNCRQTFIKSFGKRVFREPLASDRVQAYEALMTAESSFADGAQSVITAMLQSPYFVYRRELGPTGNASGTITLTPYEVASSLSYLLTGSMPDDQLLSAAESNQLGSKSQIDQHVYRLLSDPRSQDALMDFFSGWLGLSKVDTTVKDDTAFKVTDSLRSSMKGETRAFLLDLFTNGGTIADLFTAKYTFLNQEMAQYYGLSAGGVQSGSFSKVTLDGNRRDGGILSHADLLTGYADAAISSPVLRGKMVRTRLLCGTISPPPANLDTKLKPAEPSQTTRQHFEAHVAQNSVCAGCHTQMDPIGFGFEHYDAFGRWRDQESGSNIDASGTINGMPEGNVSFNGLGELSTYLAKSDAVKACAVRFWAYYAYGSSSWDQDACTYAAIQSEAASGNTKLKDILFAVVHAANFTQRLAQ